MFAIADNVIGREGLTPVSVHGEKTHTHTHTQLHPLPTHLPALHTHRALVRDVVCHVGRGRWCCGCVDCVGGLDGEAVCVLRRGGVARSADVVCVVGVLRRANEVL